MFKPHLGHAYGIGLGPKPCGDSPFCSETQRGEEEEVLLMVYLKTNNKPTKTQTLKIHFSLHTRWLRSNWAKERYLEGKRRRVPVLWPVFQKLFCVFFRLTF